MAVADLTDRARRLDHELAGLDSLETAAPPPARLAARLWAATWPKLVAAAIALAAWQLLVWSGWRPEEQLPAPAEVLGRLWSDLLTWSTWEAVLRTLRRAAVGFALAVTVGGAVGLAVSRSRVLRSGVGSLITGLQALPSIAWFPLALLLFRPSEAAVLSVVVLGAAPSVANGFVAGVDQVPPLLTRAGTSLGATGWRAYRHVTVPAALPAVVAGLKQGWAFAWRGLLAGELIVAVTAGPSLGGAMQLQRDAADTTGLLSVMLIVLLIGILVDGLLFATVERAVRRRRGLAV